MVLTFSRCESPSCVGVGGCICVCGYPYSGGLCGHGVEFFFAVSLTGFRCPRCHGLGSRCVLPCLRNRWVPRGAERRCAKGPLQSPCPRPHAGLAECARGLGLSPCVFPSPWFCGLPSPSFTASPPSLFFQRGVEISLHFSEWSHGLCWLPPSLPLISLL